MGRRRQSKVMIKWSPPFAYAIGLIATDGNMSKNGRSINITTKDRDLAETFKVCLNLNNKIGLKSRGGETEKKYCFLQFGDKNFYEFLLKIGITPAKSKTLMPLQIPEEYFADFLRGCIDGDGSIGAYNHPESKHLQLRVRLYSASFPFVEWIKHCVGNYANIDTGWIERKTNGMNVLVYAKSDSIKLFEFLYYPGVQYYLRRKYERAKPYMT